jgi:hydroxymethylbilane synthase
MKNRLLVGTRGSTLALAQTNEVIEALKRIEPHIRCDIVEIRTKGDRLHEQGASVPEGKSMYTEEIEDALTAEKVDIAVHSMKDLTTDLPKGLIIAAVPERVNPRDVLISRNKVKLDQLPGKARVGTSSPRRKAQLSARRGDLEVVDMHGNVDTRLKKLKKGEFDAIVLAAAGLIRLRLERNVTEYLSPEVMLPAVGQGALAVETRESASELRELLSKINDESTRMAVEAERAFAKRLGADCRTPIAAYARIEAGKLVINGLVATPNGSMLVRSQIASKDIVPEKVGQELAEVLLDKGAAAILEAA